jgi:Zn-dependent protease with chaperone function
MVRRLQNLAKQMAWLVLGCLLALGFGSAPSEATPKLSTVPVSGLTAEANIFGWLPFVRVAGLALASSVVLIGLFLAAGEIVSRRSLRWLAGTDPNAAVLDTEPFKRPYRVLIVLSGALYTVVLPVIALIAIIPPLAFSIVFLFLGRIPVGLIMNEIRAFFAVLTHTFGRGWRRIIRKRVKELAGTELRPEQAPKLFALLDELGAIVNTAPPDKVRLFPGTTLSVYETNVRIHRNSVIAKHARGTVILAEKERVLNIGLGALVGLDQTAFAAILCHELGHYRGGDTSASMSARRATENMIQLSHKLHKGFFSVILVWFLKNVWWVHSRVTMGAQRIQETLADRIAAQHFGAEAFERGLSHVYRRDLEFKHCVSVAIASRQARTSQLRSIYDQSLIPEVHRIMLERDLAADLSKPTTVFDSHPCPRDRFREAARTTAVGRHLCGSAFDLFEDPGFLLWEQDRLLHTENGSPLVERHTFNNVYTTLLALEPGQIEMAR